LRAALPVGVILAGGLARRMGGGDKGLLPFAGGTLLGAVIARVRPQVTALALNANGDPGRFAAYGLPVLADPVPGQPGPLAGLLAAMDWAAAQGAAQVLTLPTDTPFLPHDLVARLIAAAPGRAAIAATAGGGAHPVIGLWPVTLAPVLRSHLQTGERRVGAFAAAVGAAKVPFPPGPPGPPDPFLNLNTPEELAAAGRWM